jgi:hypothetical protein
MFTLKLEQNQLQLIQAVLAGANLNMEQSNLRNVLWASIQTQLQAQLPPSAPIAPIASEGEGED